MDTPTGYDLRLMAWGDGSGVPSAGKNLVVVGIDCAGLLHLRIFDYGGHRSADTDETQLPGQAATIATLKRRLPALFPPHELTGAEKAQVVARAVSIAGLGPPPDPEELVAWLIQDQIDCQERGERVPSEWYFENFPSLTGHATCASQLIYNEFLMDEKVPVDGRTPAPEVYLRRFPQFAEFLGRLFEVHAEAASLGGEDEPSDDRTWPEMPGFTIERELGRGSTGVVYEASQASPRRRVAIKVIRGEDLAPGQGLTRRVPEGDILAKFHHANIVQIHAELRHENRVCIVMELVRGGSLADALKGSPQPARPSAQLIQTLAEVIAYAHAEGVIHRDLKPANVLLERSGAAPPDASGKTPGAAVLYGTPKLTDFGLARLLGGPADMSRSQSLSGTPFYMAPEQIGRQFGPATDVWALGVVLYEMLTGLMPFRGPDLLSTLDLIRSADPVPPSRLQPGVTRDLEKVCLKCLEKDPARRYRRASDLADDLGRYLRGEPVHARRTPAWERAWKWSKRNPPAAALVACVVVAVVSILCLSAWYNRRLSFQRDLAVHNQVEATRQRNQALANLRLARDSVDKFCTQVSLDPRLLDLDLEGLRRELLKSAATAYESFTEQQGDDPEIVAERGRALGRLAELTAATGTRREALDLFQESVAVLEPLVRREPPVPEYQRALAVSLNNLGREYQRGRETQLAEQTYLRARTLRKALVRLEPSKLALQGELASTLGNLALLYQGTERLADAETTFEEALGLFQKVATAGRDDDEARKGVADTHGNMSLLFEHTGRRQRAEQAHRLALAARETLFTRHPTDPISARNLASSHLNLGGFYEDAGRPTEAISAYRKAIEILEGLVAGHPSVLAYQNELGKAYNNLGIFHAARSEAAPAEANLLKALELRRRLVTGHPGVSEFELDLAGSCDNLGHLYDLTGRKADAEKFLIEARDNRRALVREHPEVPDYQAVLADGCDNLGILYRSTARGDEAKAAYLESLKLRDELSRRFPQRIDYQLGWTKSKNNLGAYYDAIGQSDLARASYSEVVEKRRQLVREHPEMPELRALLARAIDNVGTGHYSAQQFEPSATSYKEALEIRRKLAADFPDNASYRGDLAVNANNLALAYVRLDRMEDAAASFDEAIRLLEVLAREQPRVSSFRQILGQSYNNLGTLYLDSRRKRRARPVYEKAVKLAEELTRQNPTVIAYQMSEGLLCTNLGSCLRDGYDQPGEARDFYDRAAKLLEDVAGRVPTNGEAVREAVKARTEAAHTLCLLERYRDSLAEWDEAIRRAQGDQKRSLEERRRDAAAMAEPHPDRALEGRTCFEQARELAGRAADIRAELGPRGGASDDAVATRLAGRALQRLVTARDARHLTQPGALERLKSDPAFEPVRALPGYRALIEKPAP